VFVPRTDRESLVVEICVLLMIAVAVAGATVLWAWTDHLRTHPWVVRPHNGVQRAVDRWERLTARASQPTTRHPAR